ncbi:MAG: nucleoside deaminase [Candidatus Marinimicrobia bacterium]|jgi:tRNA(Arg) A34 adenosine deaminase TadA|nr:nucleoside deaminase [Candidatus Neomarinimicrobiota bacterium]MEE2918054.1 nucleoside deaminase [Candidatus Neomarinimicrobiota bacterium]|tara:strand:- start:578 stop:1057 length:480 start_codon:yes stop_codon:yes gene_type:complete
MSIDQQKKFMREAIRLSMENVQSGNGGPFGTVIVKNGKIIATGVNEVTKSNDPTAHAEMIAIRNACEKLNSFQLDGCDIYCSCEPCPMCLGAIYWARPKSIYFANSKKDAAEINFDDNFIYQEIKLPIHERKLTITQLLRDEAQSVFLQWQESENKIEY